jgi:hypothetical protein
MVSRVVGEGERGAPAARASAADAAGGLTHRSVEPPDLQKPQPDGRAVPHLCGTLHALVLGQPGAAHRLG